MTTAKQQLLELSYPGDLPRDIQQWLDIGASWRDVRRHVEKATGLQVSHETLRVWYGKSEAA